MELEIAGILAVPLIIGLVEGCKRLGLDARWAFPLSVALGLALSVGYQATKGTLYEVWFTSAVVGVALGLSASGLYSGAKNTAEKMGQGDDG